MANQRPRFMKPGDDPLYPSRNKDGTIETLINPNTDTSLSSDNDSRTSFTYNRYHHLPMDAQRQRLPVFQYRSHVLYLLQRHQTLVLLGETGCGKSTQVPQYLYEIGHKVCVTQPRVVAAVSLANRVASERGEHVGQSVGYAAGMTAERTPDTGIVFMTEGVLLREMFASPLLMQYSCVVLDEVHERTLMTDVLMGLLKKIAKKRKNLKLVVSSATMDADFLKDFFNLAEKKARPTSVVMSMQGRTYPIDVVYAQEPVPDYVKATVETVIKIHENKPFGDILAFLTSQEEITEALEVLQSYATTNNQTNQQRLYFPSGIKCCDMLVLPMYGSLPYYSQIKFMQKFQFPGVVGCIDGTHVAIIRPHDNEEAYFNRKHYHSLNVLLICDADLRILHVDASFGGQSHDSHIWNNSPVKALMQDINAEEVCWLLGDSGYAQRPWMMTPILNAAPNSAEEYYTKAHVRTRNVVERCNGVLKTRWRCLLAHRVFQMADKNVRKVVLATNIAETSVTIPGIVYVIDSGFHKLPYFCPSVGVDSITVCAISKNNATQRAGRAARTAKGECYRLYTEEEYDKLPPSVPPEMCRSDLSAVMLQLKALGIHNVLRFTFPTPPPAKCLLSALETLYALGAIDKEGHLTDVIGSKMAELPLRPMCAKMLCISDEFGCMDEALSIAAMLQVDNVFTKVSGKQSIAAKVSRRNNFEVAEGDIIMSLNILDSYLNLKSEYEDEKRERKACKDWCNKMYLNYKIMEKACEIRSSLEKLIKGKFEMENKDFSGVMDLGSEKCTRLMKCILSGLFPSAASLHSSGSYRGVRGAALHISPQSCLFALQQPQWVVFASVQTSGVKTYMRDLMVIKKEWLTEVAPHFYTEI